MQFTLNQYAKLSDIWCCLFFFTAGVTGLILCIIALTPHAKNRLDDELFKAEIELRPVLEELQKEEKRLAKVNLEINQCNQKYDALISK